MRPVGDVVDDVEEDGLGPVEVVEEDDERLLVRVLLEQLAEGSCVSIGDVPITSSGLAPSCRRISTSGQYVIPSP